MKKYISVIFLLFTIYTSPSFAKEVSKKVANTVAMNFLFEQNSDIHPVLFSNLYTRNTEGTPVYYVFNFDKGFIIISADNSIFPILGYSFESNFNENESPPAFSFWMNQLEEQILLNKKLNSQAPKHVAHIWENYLSENFIPKNISESVAPLLSTSWDQGCYYNSAFPADANVGQCGHPYAGCVAVVMGQIMKYYNWPKTGIGENTISSPYGPLTANFGNTTYNWSGMESYLNSENSSVTELIYHASIAVNSEFFPLGTGAYDFNIPPALINYFGYKETAQFIPRSTYFGDWEALIKYELDNSRPVIYGGVDMENLAGHTFICDGYQDESFFHFNWGWGGTYNGYYYLDSLIVGPYHYDFQHDIVIGIEPGIDDEIILYPPTNLSSNVELRDVTLTWNSPTGTSSLELLGYNVFRNDTLLNKSILTTTGFTDFNAPPGNHVYKVNTAFIGVGNGPYTSVDTYISSISNRLLDAFVYYPNPAKEVIFIKTSLDVLKLEKVELFETSGKKIYSLNILLTSDKIFKVDLPKDLNGLYILKLTNDKASISKKLIIDSH